MKYKDIDEIVTVLESYDQKVKLDIEELRDKRLRRHFKERFDFRVNQIDWDY